MPHELLLIFVGGLLGSAHCVGMCGGFALSIGAQGNLRTTTLKAFPVEEFERIVGSLS